MGRVWAWVRGKKLEEETAYDIDETDRTDRTDRIEKRGSIADIIVENKRHRFGKRA
jgi:hypothetical protein